MKQISISKFKKIETGYEVYLGNGFRFIFGSERQTKAFLADTNRFLTQQLHSCNSLLGDIQFLYRENWGYFFDPKKPHNTHMKDIACKSYLGFADDCLEKAISLASHSQNGNFWPFHNLTKCCENLRDAIFIIKELNAKNSNGATVYKCIDLLTRVSNIKIQIDTYGQLEAKGTIPLHSFNLIQSANKTKQKQA